MRRHFTFACEGETLAATLDGGSRQVGLLIISGGNEVRAGAFCGQAQLARDIATEGFAVMRFDRRGVGDSSGENGGYRSSAPDIAAALAAFRNHAPEISRIVAFGNCDAATALALLDNIGQQSDGCTGLILANPWTFADTVADEPALPPPSAIRARYVAKMRDSREWLRLLRGGVDMGKLARGLKGAGSRPPAPSSLTEEIAAGLAAFTGDVHILLAGRDRTAQAFAASWPADDPRVATMADADHAFSNDPARQWLRRAILAALYEQARQLDMG